MRRIETAIFLIGDELLCGDIADGNGPFLAERLTAQGCRVRSMCVLPDETEVIARAVTRAIGRYALAVLCGGLGPTSDDRTTGAVAQALGLDLVLDPDQWERILQIFLALQGREPPPGNEKQVSFPQGAEVLPNELGTAPGYVLRAGSCALAVLPGPPRENRPMVDGVLMPWVRRNLSGGVLPQAETLRIFGLAESEIGHRLKPLEARFRGISFRYRFAFPEILVTLREEQGASGGRLAVAAGEVGRVLSPHVYGTGERRLPAVLGGELARRGLRVVTAESCTGGLAAQLLTETAGSSAWMERGFVTYSNTSKTELLGVPGALLEKTGAVSEPVARAMLQGALDRSPADVGLAVTGVAGPGGGTDEKPVGTVCIAWGDRRRAHSAVYRFLWDREYNRLVSAWAAMRRLHLHVLGRTDP